MKKVTFKEESNVITILCDEGDTSPKTLEVKDYALTGEGIYTFLAYKKGDLYDVQPEGESDSSQMKELKKLFTNIKTKINAYSSAGTAVNVDSLKK